MHISKQFFVYLFLEREEGRENGRESFMCKRNMDWLSLACPQLGTWPTAKACALTGNGTSNPSVCGMMPNPLSHTDQGLGPYLENEAGGKGAFMMNAVAEGRKLIFQDSAEGKWTRRESGGVFLLSELV